jgi:hypothetical protein
MSEEQQKPEPRHPQVRDHIVYHDENGKAHDALVTAYWGNPTTEDGAPNQYIGCLNLVFVSDDAERRDQYGRQIERLTSISHKSTQHTHGFYWRWPDEEPNPYTPPSSV